MYLFTENQMPKANNKIKKGAKIKIVAPHHNLTVGTVTEIAVLNPNGTHFSTKENLSYWLSEYDVEFLPLTKEELQSSLKAEDDKILEIEKNKEEILAKISWLDETGATEYDETEYKVYKTLQTVNSASTDLEKAKVIAALIKG